MVASMTACATRANAYLDQDLLFANDLHHLANVRPHVLKLLQLLAEIPHCMSEMGIGVRHSVRVLEMHGRQST